MSNENQNESSKFDTYPDTSSRSTSPSFKQLSESFQEISNNDSLNDSQNSIDSIYSSQSPSSPKFRNRYAHNLSTESNSLKVQKTDDSSQENYDANQSKIAPSLNDSMKNKKAVSGISSTGDIHYPIVLPNKTIDYLSIIVYTVLVLLVAPFVINYMFSSSPKNEKLQCEEFISLQNKYANQDNITWFYFKSGLERILNKKPTRPSIFMLIHNIDNDINNIVDDLAHLSHKCLGNFKQFYFIIYSNINKICFIRNSYITINFKSTRF